VKVHRVSDVISMPAGFRRHLVGKTLIKSFTHKMAAKASSLIINVFHSHIAEIRSVGKLVIIQTFS